MYPTLVIIVVASHRSVLERHGSAGANTEARQVLPPASRPTYQASQGLNTAGQRIQWIYLSFGKDVERMSGTFDAPEEFDSLEKGPIVTLDHNVNLPALPQASHR